MGDYSASVYYDSSGEVIKILNYSRFGAYAGYTEQKPDDEAFLLKYQSSSRIENTDSIVTTIKIMNYDGIADTISVATSKFNSVRKLIFNESIRNPGTRLEDCTDQENFHYEYGYDSEGRLTYYRNFEESEYLKVSYSENGRISEYLDSQNNQVKYRKVLLTHKGKDRLILTTATKQIVMNYIERGSSLISLITTFHTGESPFPGARYPFVQYCEIVYR